MPFTKRALGFFRGLARHNEKSWFEAHRDEFETIVTTNTQRRDWLEKKAANEARKSSAPKPPKHPQL